MSPSLRSLAMPGRSGPQQALPSQACFCDHAYTHATQSAFPRGRHGRHASTSLRTTNHDLISPSSSQRRNKNLHLSPSGQAFDAAIGCIPICAAAELHQRPSRCRCSAAAFSSANAPRLREAERCNCRCCHRAPPFFFPPPFLSLSPARILDDSEMIRAYGVSALVMVVEHLSCRPRSIDRITKRGLPFAPARTQASTWIPRLATESSSSSSPMPFYLAGSQPRSIYIHAFPSRAWMFRMMPLQFWVWLSPSTLDSITSEYTSQGSECWSHSL